MAEYTAFNCTVIGQRYIDKAAPCEDYSVSWNEGDVHIAITADGHGDKTCFRSYVGSKMACQAALESMQEFAAGVRDNGLEEQLLTPKGGSKLATSLFEVILDRWKRMIMAQLQENPPTEEEYESTGAQNAAIYRAGKHLEHIYGTTLIAMLKTSRYLLVLHQGDGRCVVFHENGKVDQPVPWDPRCEGRSTASLCDSDVLKHWRYLIIDLQKDKIIGSFAISDGIEDSFEEMKELHAYLCMHVSDYVRLGHDAYCAALPEHFAALTKNGSQDDISLGGILDAAAAEKYAPLYVKLYGYYTAKAERRRATERLNSMQRKTEYLTDQLQKAKAEYQAAREHQQEKKSILERLFAQLEIARDDCDNSERAQGQSEEKLAKIQAEYDAYMQLRQTFVDKAEENRLKMEALSEDIRNYTVEPPARTVNAEPLYVQPTEATPGFDTLLTPGESAVGAPEKPAVGAPEEPVVDVPQESAVGAPEEPAADVAPVEAASEEPAESAASDETTEAASDDQSEEDTDAENKKCGLCFWKKDN